MRSVLTLCAAPIAGVVLLWLAPLPETVHALPADAQAGGDPADAVVHLCACAAWLLVGWLALAAATTLAARLPGVAGRTAAALARRITPAVVRRALEGTAVLGLAVSPALLPGGALASTCAPGRLPALDRTATSCAPTAAPHLVTPPAAPAAPRIRTVVAGDTLWGLAAEELDAGGRPATPHRIAERWPAWWHANRAVIGGDPDLIHIGTVLVVPDSQEKTG